MDNKSTKKYLLKSKGNRALDDVSSKMKLIENSLGLDSSGSKSDLKDINGIIYELEGEIKTKENQIAEWVSDILMLRLWFQSFDSFQIVQAAPHSELQQRWQLQNRTETRSSRDPDECKNSPNAEQEGQTVQDEEKSWLRWRWEED